MSPRDLLLELRKALSEGGARSAIALLNAQTEHRFTSMFRFDGGMLNTVVFYDRADPSARPPDDIPVEASYCVYIRDSEKPFLVEDSLSDLRVEMHPKCQEIRSYYGVPLKDRNGAIFGTLCHFDFQPIPISEETIRLMEEFACLLTQFGTK